MSAGSNQFVSLAQVLRGPIVDKNGQPTRELIKKLQEFDSKLRDSVNLNGQLIGLIKGLIDAGAKISGRTEGIGTTVGKLDANGIVLAAGADFARAYANKDTDHITDGTGNPLTGGKRGFNALDVNSRLASSFRNNPLNTQAAYTGANPLSAITGGSANHATINIAANTQQFGPGQVNYNSGSITPLLDSTLYYIYTDDPTFAGGAVIYHATTNQADLTASDGRVYLGKITTPAFGGGGTSGSGGGGGSCFEGSVQVITPARAKRFHELPDVFTASTIYGWRTAHLLKHPYKGEMRHMGEGELVTPGHRFKHDDKWIPARQKWSTKVFFAGTVYNASIETDSDQERHYELANREIAHNLSQL